MVLQDLAPVVHILAIALAVCCTAIVLPVSTLQWGLRADNNYPFQIPVKSCFHLLTKAMQRRSFA